MFFSLKTGGGRFARPPAIWALIPPGSGGQRNDGSSGSEIEREVLDREVLAGKKKLGMFYGAAYFPDMEKRLLAVGWTKAGD